MIRQTLYFLLLTLLFTGCSSSKPPMTMQVTTDPVGSNVYFDGENVGKSPCKIEVPKDGETHYLMIEKTGYQKVIKTFSNNDYQEKVDIALDPKTESGDSSDFQKGTEENKEEEKAE